MLISRLIAALILAASIGALASALVAEHVFGLLPCPLCVYQRWPYVATAALAALAMATAARGHWPAAFVGLACVVFAGESALAFYHVGVEQGWFEGLAACAGAGETPATLDALRQQLLEGPPPPRCDEPAWTLFGVSMAGYNVIYAAVLAGFAGAAAVVMTKRVQT